MTKPISERLRYRIKTFGYASEQVSIDALAAIDELVDTLELIEHVRGSSEDDVSVGNIIRTTLAKHGKGK